MNTAIKTVFHVHTDYSDDGNASVQDVCELARRHHVGCVAITDHDTSEGGHELAAIAGTDLAVIIGQEISTADGHLVGLFLREPVPPAMPVRRTAEAIRNQGGLVIVPHPFNTLFGCSLRDKTDDILDLIDAVEIANAQNLSPIPNRRAQAFARRHGLPGIVGADTHHRGYLDRCWQYLAPFDGPQGFLASLRTAHFVPGTHPLSYFVRSGWVILRYKLGFGIPPAYGRNCTDSRPAAAAGTLALPGD